MNRIAITLALIIGASSCAAIQPARMALPPSLAAAAETVTIAGIGGGQAGSYVAGSTTGTFSRSATRLAFFDPLFEMRDGRTSFTMEQSAMYGPLRVSCRMRQRTITLDIVSFDPDPMAFGCDVSSEGRPFPANFEIQAHSEGLGGMLMREERRGEIAFDGVILSVRSIHDLEGSPFQLAIPIGYVFERNGMAVGAVETNGNPVVFYGAGTDAPTRQAVLIASLALGLFWDPAGS